MNDRTPRVDNAAVLSNVRPTYKAGGHRANGPALDTRRNP
jgi:hypothetical protein